MADFPFTKSVRAGGVRQGNGNVNTARRKVNNRIFFSSSLGDRVEVIFHEDMWRVMDLLVKIIFRFPVVCEGVVCAESIIFVHVSMK